MNKLETFEMLLQECKSAVERTVFFRISRRADAEDVLQEVYITAYCRFDTLMDLLAFKAWIISIARNKCVDYYRRQAARAELPMEMLSERVMAYGRCGPRQQMVVRETLEQLGEKDRDILKLCYFQELPQAEIAKKLRVPLGTVKSRLHTARENFRELYPNPPGRIWKNIEKEPKKENAEKNGKTYSGIPKTIESLKAGKAQRKGAEKEKFMNGNIENREAAEMAGIAKNAITKEAGNGTEKTAISEAAENETKKTVTLEADGNGTKKVVTSQADGNGTAVNKVLPEFLPEYTITQSKEAPFETVWEELQGWMIVPRLGEHLTWGLYEMPSRKRTEYTKLKVTGRAQVHGIEGVEIAAVQYDAEDYYRTGSVNEMERRFVAQLTDTHSRYLAESHVENGVRKCYTFLDGDSFMKNWGFGEDNCGNETHVAAKGILQRTGKEVVCAGRNDVGSRNGIQAETDDGSNGKLDAAKMDNLEKNCQHMDVVGRYTVTIAGKSYDTICVMDVESFDDAIATESYIDKNGRTVLWRRFNRDDWAVEHFGGRGWSEALPDNERLMIDGRVYVHWYDCISDYIL